MPGLLIDALITGIGLALTFNLLAKAMQIALKKESEMTDAKAPLPSESEQQLVRNCRYWGFLGGYCAATGRNIQFKIPNREVMLGAFNGGFEDGHRHGARGLDGLVETAVMNEMGLFRMEWVPEDNERNGGVMPPRKAVSSICGPT